MAGPQAPQKRAVMVVFFLGARPGSSPRSALSGGITAIADSAQFSASVVELADAERVGTMVTVQTR